MRRLLLPELPLLSRFYGIHPWQVERLTLREISEYKSQLQQVRSQGGDPWQVGRAE